ncbi:uncharacterized protein LOC119078828 [Bradysia coprophila]|uniref:uncharacterized protein LOC119078828 n=1 Tax=Bradysia coprophila TaxID=38358 RepID=UPI00187DBC4C|nr:uncharacterized protein LOC119078828 [Bradysia coprophila]
MNLFHQWSVSSQVVIMKFGVVLIALIHISAATAGILIECEYKNGTVVTLNNYDRTLMCYANITSTLPAESETTVRITPSDATQRHQVEYFRLVDQDISNNLDNVLKAVALSFPKLRAIRLGNVSIDHISKNNLKSFPELELISLDNNKISVLDSDLFSYTPKLKFIYLDFNNITNVDDNLLNSLDYIEADFSSNPCITQSTCKSELHHEKLKDTNPTLFHYFQLMASIAAVLEENPKYGR